MANLSLRCLSGIACVAGLMVQPTSTWSQGLTGAPNAPTLSANTAKGSGSGAGIAMSMIDPVGSFAPMLDLVIPSVVTILVAGEALHAEEMKSGTANGVEPAFPTPRREIQRSGGSGVIVDAERGHILTNNHVVTGATSIEVVLSDGRRMSARLIGIDPGTDVAVVEVAERNLKGIRIGDSDKSRVGDVVLAVGNPFGLEGTATLGIISALMRTGVGHEAIEDFMQIDAAINPGNSGGALVNVQGELIGINTAGSGEGSRALGIGFAIPINMARAIKAELIAHGRMRRGSIGIKVEDLGRERSEALAMRITRGAVVADLLPRSPAANVGIRKGDIVTHISGKPVRDATEFATRVASVPIGKIISVTVDRDGRSLTNTLAPEDIPSIGEPRVLPPSLAQAAGAVVDDIGLGNRWFGQQRGVEVISVPEGSAAHRSGLRSGDIIVSLAEMPVRSVDDLLRLANRAGMQYRLSFVRERMPAWIRMSR